MAKGINFKVDDLLHETVNLKLDRTGLLLKFVLTRALEDWVNGKYDPQANVQTDDISYSGKVMAGTNGQIEDNTQYDDKGRQIINVFGNAQ